MKIYGQDGTGGNPRIKMIVYKAKKLFCGHVSIRDYIVRKAIRNNETIRVTYERKKMNLSVEQLKRAVSTFHAQEFKSAFNAKTYKLYDFAWRADEDNPAPPPPAPPKAEEAQEAQLEFLTGLGIK